MNAILERITDRFATFLIWPTCSRCQQSCTGCYGGTPRCLRCESGRTKIEDRR